MRVEGYRFRVSGFGHRLAVYAFRFLGLKV